MIFCISDLHLADRGPRDNFHARGPERFNKFLDFVHDNKAKLYILGDCFDFWQVNPGNCILAYEKLIDSLTDMKSVWVVGNHDGAFLPLIGTKFMIPQPFFQAARSDFVETIGDKHFLFQHGHESDPYCKNMNPGIGEITAIISGMMEDQKGPFQGTTAVEDQFVGTLDKTADLWRKVTRQASRLDEMINGVEAYRKQMKADVVVYGHTHEPGQIGYRHFNCGTWARMNDTFVQINDDGTTTLHEWIENHAVPFNKSLR